MSGCFGGKQLVKITAKFVPTVRFLLTMKSGSSCHFHAEICDGSFEFMKPDISLLLFHRKGFQIFYRV